MEPHKPSAARHSTASAQTSGAMRIWQPQAVLTLWAKQVEKWILLGVLSTSQQPVFGLCTTTQTSPPRKAILCTCKSCLLSQHEHIPTCHGMLIDEVCDAVQTGRGSKMKVANFQSTPS